MVVPRRKEFGEIVNDHQFELVRELEAQGRIYAVYDIVTLPDVVRSAREQGAAQHHAIGGSRIAGIVKDYLDRLSEGKHEGE